MPLHPQVVRFLAAQRALQLKPVEDCTPGEFRAMMRAGIGVDGTTGRIDTVGDREIPGPLGPIPIRLYGPSKRQSEGVLVYFHGGGWVGGDLDTHDVLCRALAAAAGCLVIAVDYRLAPEHRYPAAAEDAHAVLHWVWEHAAELGVAPDRIAIGGDSAGGNLAAVVSLMVRDRGQTLPCLQVLIYPIVDCDFTTSSYRRYAQGYSLTGEGMKWFWQHYAPDRASFRQPYAAPLRADQLAGLPPALVLTAECDVLGDEGHAYAARLRSEGVPTEATCYEGMIHGFVSRVNLFDAAREAVTKIADTLQRSFDR